MSLIYLNFSASSVNVPVFNSKIKPKNKTRNLTKTRKQRCSFDDPNKMVSELKSAKKYISVRLQVSILATSYSKSNWNEIMSAV